MRASTASARVTSPSGPSMSRVSMLPESSQSTVTRGASSGVSVTTHSGWARTKSMAATSRRRSTSSARIEARR